MRIAAIYDIHGNLPALEAIIKEIREESFDLVVVGGDVFPGPMPDQTLACLTGLDIPTEFIRGNGDREVLARMRGIETNWYRKAPEQVREPVRWTAGQLSEEHGRHIAKWAAMYRVEFDDLGEVLFCHATPRDDNECFTRITPDEKLVAIFANSGARLVVCGHTHMQFDRKIGNVRVLNAGSAGMPFGKPGAYWLELGPDIRFRHTSYDLVDAAARIQRTEYPQVFEFARKNILRPPSESAMLDVLSRVELK